MKLHEIVQTKDNPNLTGPDPENTIGAPSAFAKVGNDPDDPHMVKKSTPMNDPYNYYLQWLMDNDAMSSNPYFPRVYEKRDQGDQRHLQMEKLQEFNTLSDQELEAMTNRLLKDVTVEDTIQSHLKDYSWSSNINKIERNVRADPATAVANYIKKSVNENDFRDKIKDPMFAKALSVVRSLAMNFDKYADLHSGNFMIRRGPTGPQLVIIDPLS